MRYLASFHGLFFQLLPSLKQHRLRPSDLETNFCVAPPPAFAGDGQSRVLLRCPLGSLALSPSPLIIFIVSIFLCEPCLLCQQAYL